MKSSKKLSCILIIDDDPASNFFHQNIIEELDSKVNIQICQDAEHALEYLVKKSMFSEFRPMPAPDLILLDIYMPGMSGWDFIEEYNKIRSQLQKEATIAMISSSSDPKDLLMAEENTFVQKFIPKAVDGIHLKNWIIENYPLQLN